MPVPLTGILNFNKPTDWTSRDVVNKVHGLVKPAKAGHAGTLDPLATGVLLVCIGSATRLITHLQAARKVYDAEFLLGKRSNTEDITGEITPAADVTIPTSAQISELLPEFTGHIQQIPPMFSAVHVDGKRAYKLARQGEEVEMPPREIEVYSLSLLEYDYPRLRLKIECGSGTYVRSLGRDIGERLGCGALMSQLARTAIGEFTQDAGLNPETITREQINAHRHPVGCAVRHLPRYVCTPEEWQLLRHGRGIGCFGREDLAETEWVAIWNQRDEFVCFAEYQPNYQRLHPRQVFHPDDDPLIH